MEIQTENIIKVQRQHDIERNDRVLLANNIIVFGMTEQKDIESTVGNLNRFFRRECHMNLELSPMSVTRLGEVVGGKNRPLRVALESEDKKWQVLKRVNAVRVQGVFAD